MDTKAEVSDVRQGQQQHTFPFMCADTFTYLGLDHVYYVRFPGNDSLQ